MGSEVTQFVRGPHLLRGFDQDIAALLATHMEQRHVQLRYGHEVRRIDQVAGGLQVSASNGDVLEVDAVILCTGRQPNTSGLGLAPAGVATAADGSIVVDDFGRTNIESIYAIGDVTNRVNLTPVAIREGHALADRIFGGMQVPPLDYGLVPTAVFSTPEIGVVGMTEAAARAQFPALRVLTTQFRAMGQAFAGSQEQVFIKVLVDGATDRVLGMHLLGDRDDPAGGCGTHRPCHMERLPRHRGAAPHDCGRDRDPAGLNRALPHWHSPSGTVQRQRTAGEARHGMRHGRGALTEK
jgi:glutathione reductase (NADPH)